MSLSNYPRTYGTVAISVAFVAGIIVTLGFKDLYPDLERRYQRRRGRATSSIDSRRGSTHLTPVKLEDHTRRPSTTVPAAPPIPCGIEGTIGHTPIFEIKSLSEATGCSILAKAEFLNGAGNSPKDRVALQMIIAAEEAGLLTPNNGDTIYEGTSGSTGISLASLARARGYKAHICMDTDQSLDKVNLLHHLGATVERVSPAPITSVNHYVNLARTRAAEHAEKMGDGSKGFFTDQFENSANWAAHHQGTGPEILSQTGGELAAFVAGAGTGGTISGVASYLKEDIALKDIRIVLADPQGSGLYNKVKYGVMFSDTEKEGTRRRTQVDSIVEGIGINRLTENFEKGRELIDDAVKVTDVQAARMARWLVEKDGVFAGSSSAVNCVAAVVTALRLKEEGKEGRVVTLLCDSGARHLSKFWKTVGELGLEHEHEGMGLLEVLGLDKDGT
ncbi:MAG: Cysteine synthase 2 [Claussenomyces sp. TS43310]|nr:MAG: Cysteine synthase 2 [Claussenomyces sp. TS43310]